MIINRTTALGWLALLLAAPISGQEPVAWGDEFFFSTFSIAAIDPTTGEAGVAVTTRNPCVGAAVPWIKAGVGAVATQASARTEYGDELLDMMAKGMSPADALARGLAADSARESRQLGVIAMDGRSAQHTGKGNNAWAGGRAGPNYVTQGNILVGPQVVEAVGRTFEASEGSGRWLADRLIEAINAGHLQGGDGRHGENQSAAVMVKDPRPEMSRRKDGQTVFIHVCEHPEPVLEMRRIYNTISETLGYRELSQQSGADVVSLKMLLHALGYFQPSQPEISTEDRNVYTQEAVDAVDKFKTAQGWKRSSVPGFVDAEVIARLWSEAEKAGKAAAVRERLHPLNRVAR